MVHGDRSLRYGQGPSVSLTQIVGTAARLAPALNRVQVMCRHMEVGKVLGCRGQELEVQVGSQCTTDR